MGATWNGIKADEVAAIQAEVLRRRGRALAKGLSRAYRRQLEAQVDLAIARSQIAAWQDSGLPVIPGFELPREMGPR